MNRNYEHSYDGEVRNIWMLEYANMQGKGVLETIGLSTCIGVCIYDPAKKHAFLGHFVYPASTPNDEFEQFLTEAKTTLQGASRLRVWVGGGEVNGHTFDQEVNLCRGRVSTRLGEELGATMTLREEWLDESGAIDYAIDVETGEETVEVHLCEDEEQDSY